VGQQLGGAIPNAADLCGQHSPVKPTLAFGPDRSDQHAELVCKRGKPFFHEISCQLLLLCDLGHCHDSSVRRIDCATRWNDR